MEREVGGVIGMGNTCKSMADSFQCMTKPTTIKKKKKRLFSCSSLSAIRVVPSAYLRLLLFLPAILIPVYASSNPPFHIMYSVYKLNKQGDNIYP